MKALCFAVALLTACVAVQAVHGAPDSDAQMRINQIQIIGSHNSYHAGLLPGMRAFLE